MKHRYPDSEKYYVETCQSQINDTRTTQGWIELEQMLKKVARRDIDLQKSQLLIAQKQSQKIVVKLGNQKVKGEYDMGCKVRNVKGFVKFICYFECEDDFYRYFEVETGYLCRDAGKSMSVLLMPYFEMGSLGGYSWSHENNHVLRSCIKHACCSLVTAFQEKRFVHGDFHPLNVLLKPSKESAITYGDIEVPVHGIRPWIMDFENSYIATADNQRALVDFFYDLKKFFILLPHFIPAVQKTSIRACEKALSEMEEVGVCDLVALCEMVDKI